MENILVDVDGYLKMIDFGVSKIVNPDRPAATNVGTVYYKAPEIDSGGTYGFTVDWWALGVCIYTMLNGTFPFENEKGFRRKYKVNWFDDTPVSSEAKDLV